MNDDKKYTFNHQWWIAAVLLLITICFIFDVFVGTKEIKENPIVDKKFVSADTVRDPLSAPEIRERGSIYRCNDCHQDIEPSEADQRHFAEDHENITLEHGINDRCYNCHNKTQRETLVDMDGNEIPFSQSELLCRKCHGPKYRDWKAGVHGRPNGYWDKSKGESVKVICAACHNPHSPKFKPMEPAPAPVQDH